MEHPPEMENLLGNIFYIFGCPLGQFKFGSRDSWRLICAMVYHGQVTWFIFPQFLHPLHPLHPLHALNPSDHRPIVSDSV